MRPSRRGAGRCCRHAHQRILEALAEHMAVTTDAHGVADAATEPDAELADVRTRNGALGVNWLHWATNAPTWMPRQCAHRRDR
ncbi:MAG: hypothetical protein R2851_28855 [Caldilineaceae bacterium]